MDSPTVSKSSTRPRFPLGWLLVTLVIGIGVGIGGYAWIQKDNDSKSTEPTGTTSQNEVISPSSTTVPVGWKTVTNSTGHYSFAYPGDWERLAVFESESTTAVGTPSNVQYLASKPGTEVSPDFKVIYYEKPSELTAINESGEQVNGFKSLALFIETVRAANVGQSGKTEVKTVGQYAGYYSDQLPGIGSTDYLVEIDGHVYVLSFNASEQATADQIVSTFRVSE